MEELTLGYNSVHWLLQVMFRWAVVMIHWLLQLKSREGE